MPNFTFQVITIMLVVIQMVILYIVYGQRTTIPTTRETFITLVLVMFVTLILCILGTRTIIIA